MFIKMQNDAVMAGRKREARLHAEDPAIHVVRKI
jgi:hypothetical protein